MIFCNMLKCKSKFRICYPLINTSDAGWFLYLSIIFSKGSPEVSMLLKKLWLLVIPTSATIFTKYLLKTLATSTSFLIISPDSFKKMFSRKCLSVNMRTGSEKPFLKNL